MKNIPVKKSVWTKNSDWTNIFNLKVFRKILYWAPLLLFNIFVNDLFFFSVKCEICNFADGNCRYSCGMNLDNIFSNLIQVMQNAHAWFVYNESKS